MAMSTTTQMPTEREDIEMLLPWYVTGKLVAPDRARVEAWLKSDPDLARQVDLIRAEQIENLRANDAVRAPASLTVEQTMAALHRSGRSSPVAGLVGRIRNFFVMPAAGPVRWAAAAAGAVMLAQAGAVGYLVSQRQGESYQTASGGQSVGQTAAQPGAYALVRFADSATAAGIAAALSELDMRVVDGPRQGGLFRVRIGAADMSEKDRDDRLDALRRRPGLVVLVTPSP
jgi:anti-sigma factor RsiW